MIVINGDFERLDRVEIGWKSKHCSDANHLIKRRTNASIGINDANYVESSIDKRPDSGI